MRWWRKAPPCAPVDVDADPAGAEALRREAERELKRVRAQRSEVGNVSRKLRDIKKRNGFADLISEALAERTDQPWSS